MRAEDLPRCNRPPIHPPPSSRSAAPRRSSGRLRTPRVGSYHPYDCLYPCTCVVHALARPNGWRGRRADDGKQNVRDNKQIFVHNRIYYNNTRIGINLASSRTMYSTCIYTFVVLACVYVRNGCGHRVVRVIAVKPGENNALLQR